MLGLGVPQVTATVDCAAARDYYHKQSGRYVPIITDGGMSKGGDVCKALACGSDAVMVGSAFARSEESPGQGFHWGMATPHANLPRGTRIKVGVTGSLQIGDFGGTSTFTIDGGDVYWIENRPAEAGRSVVVRCAADGTIADAIPSGFNARTRVHEYGGGAWWARDGVLVYSELVDQQLRRIDAGTAPASTSLRNRIARP